MIEFDTAKKRQVGLLIGHQDDALLYKARLHNGEFNRAYRTTKLADIIAFRLLSVEVESVPADLR